MDILSRCSTRPVEIARRQAICKALAEPKPNGLRPTTAEVARWFNRDRATITRAVREMA